MKEETESGRRTGREEKEQGNEVLERGGEGGEDQATDEKGVERRSDRQGRFEGNSGWNIGFLSKW